MTTIATFPADLSEPFAPDMVKKNPKGFDYVAIDGYINRLNQTVGANWSWVINDHELRYEGIPNTNNGKMQFLAVVRGTLTIVGTDHTFIEADNTDSDYLATITFESSRDGIGADVSFDPDKALKTAQAEALKKACHQFGIALYLWDDEQRGYLDLQRKAAISEDDLKRLAVAYVQRTLGTDEMPSKDIIADTLGMDADDLSNNTLLRAALTNKGAL
jgi:hypothetical protein